MAYKGNPYGLERFTSNVSFKSPNLENITTDTFYTGAFNTRTQPMDPLITGYSFIKWIKIPSWVEKKYGYFTTLTEKNLKSFNGNDDVEISTVSASLGFTGNESQFAGAIGSKGSGFTMSHIEYANSPVSDAYDFWVSSVRDPHSGIATYPSLSGEDYCARNHTGELLYVVLKPSVARAGDEARAIYKDIESATYYTNVMPLKISRSHWNFTAGSQDAVNLDVNFTADRWFGGGVLEYAASVIESFSAIQCLHTENEGTFAA
jgi:hypothetical protein